MTGKAKPRVIWKCLEKCAHHCEIKAIDTIDARLDKKWSVESFPTRCPFYEGEMRVAFDGKPDTKGR